MIGILGKSTSADAKYSRESLTSGGYQNDNQQLMNDLKDSVERESDLKEQLKFAEEEVKQLILFLKIKDQTIMSNESMRDLGEYIRVDNNYSF